MTLDLLRALIVLTLVSTATVVAVLLIRRPVRRTFGASVSYGLWLLVPVSMLAVLLPGSPEADSGFTISMQIGAVSSLMGHALSRPQDVAASAHWPAWLLGIWGAGVALSLIWFAGLQRSYLKSLGALSDKDGTLRAESSAGCPALIGVLRPKVVLPPDFETRYTAQERSLILAHENVHLQRRDSMWNALAALLRCVFWFNPLMHAAANRMRVDQEIACDAAVIDGHPASRSLYAGAMLKTELADAALPAGCHWRSAHPFKERLEMLKSNIPSRARRTWGAGLVTVASITVGYAAWAAEPTLTTAPVLEAAPPADLLAPPALLPGQRKAVLRLTQEAQVQTSADVVTVGPNGETILEGNVRIQVIPPENAGPTHNRLVRKTPNGDVLVETVKAPRATTLFADKAVITPLAGGDIELVANNARLETVP